VGLAERLTLRVVLARDLLPADILSIESPRDGHLPTVSQVLLPNNINLWRAGANAPATPSPALGGGGMLRRNGFRSNVMQCENCGAENRADRRFCGQCGTPLAIACPTCGAANEGSDRFCGRCGSSLGDSAGPVAGGPATISERRLVSVLFADLVGFTSLAEHRDPEEVRELLSRYFERCRALIEQYGGVVEKFIGDAVMAVWGTPVAREDDAERSVRAALALTQAVPALGEQLGMSGLRVRAGVLTGSAAVDLAAEGEGMVLGDAVNTASRLQSVAAPGTVLVDDVTRRTTEAAIAYDEAGTHDLKGRDQPVRAWSALRVVAGVGGARRSPGLEAPFVGRDAELEHVIGAWEAGVAEGTARLVTVVGDAGAGKSRLLWEYFKHIDGLQRIFRWHQGRCLSYGEGVGYWALAEMVRSRAGILEDEVAVAARAKLRDAVERYVPDERERRLVEPRLAHLLGLEQRVASDRADLFSGWRLFFERVAATGPVMMVFEDVQWADIGLLDFIDYLIEWSAEYPIFVLALARPEITTTRPAWRSDITLAPLADEAMREALDGLVPGLPDEVGRRILARAEGVPLYAIETIRMLLDRGLLTQDGARYVVTGDVGDLDVPETLHALVAARLDGLEPLERTTLQFASVLGQSFTPPAVAALSGRSVDDVRTLLDGLVAKQVLSFEDDERSPERGQYRFLQGLVRTIAYSTLSRRDRKASHLAAARHLQEASGSEIGDVAEVLASHFLEAARADPEAPDAVGIRASARETLAEAGRRALSLALGGEAQRAFDQAAELADDDEERASLLEQAGRAAWLEADATGGRDRLEAAIALYEAVGRTQAAARALGSIADILWTSNALDEALAVAEGAYARLTEDTADRAAMAALVGKLRFFSDDASGTLEATEQALELAEPMELWDTIADALITRGSVLVWMDRPEEGQALVRHGTEIAVAHDLPSTAIRGYNNLGWIAELHDHLDEVEAHQERCRELARARGDRVWLQTIQAARVGVTAQRGNWDEAERMADALPIELLALDTDILGTLSTVRAARGDLDGLEVLDRHATAGLDSADDQIREVCVITHAGALAARGEHAKAIELLAPLARRTLTSYRQQAVLAVLESALALGRHDVVQETVTMVRELPPAAATPTMRAHADRFEALLLARSGDAAEAERLLMQAATKLAESGRPFERAKALLDHGELLVAGGRLTDAGPVLRDAAGIFSDLRAEPWRQRAERALGREGAVA
jgi:class 3 adenylate cyclase/tetratricopeptide (TPR) repeat protein